VKFVSSKESEVGEKKGEKLSEVKPSEQPIPSLSPSTYSFIVNIVGEIFTRVSFASRGSMRGE
jgi:hypothetical protein